MRNFLNSLVTYMPVFGANHEFQLFSPSAADAIPVPPRQNLRLQKCSGVPSNRIGRALYHQVRLPGVVSRNGVDIWIGTCNILPTRLTCRSVLFIQSLQFLSHAEGYGLPRLAYLRVMVPASIKRADLVIAFSQSSRDEILRRYRINPKNVRVIHHAARFSLENPMNYGKTLSEKITRKVVGASDYILSVSAFYKYKNLERLIEAFARIKPQYSQHKLAITGSETDVLSIAKLKSLAKHLGVEADVAFLGHVSDETLLALYRNATLMAMPSLEETFGLPILEAMAMGCPVVTSDLSSMPEIVGESGMLVDPYDVESIATGLDQVLSDDGLRTRMSEKGIVRSQVFSNDRFYSKLNQAIKSLSTSS